MVSIYDQYLETILSLGIDRDYNLKDIANGMTHYFQDKLIYNLDSFPKIDIEKSKNILVLNNNYLIVEKLFK